MPVLVEEEFKEAKRLIDENPEINVIIPHTGKLNGGYDQMQAFYAKENMYFDTSTASIDAIRKCLEAVGAKQIIFGSDVTGRPNPSITFQRLT